MFIRIAAIPGDGIGPEVIGPALDLFHTLCERHGISGRAEILPYGADHFISTGETLPDAFVENCKTKYTAILFGAVGDPKIGSHDYSSKILLRLRRELDLYINFRPFDFISMNKYFCINPIDFVVFRENTEDIYTGSGGILKRGKKDIVAIENAVFTKDGVDRIIEAAFAHARNNRRQSVTLCDKSNVMIYAGKLWQDSFREIGAHYPDIERRHFYIDALCMELVRNPQSLDVVVTSNMFGDIVSDLACQMVGGIGLGASVSRNAQDGDFRGLYEPIHGSAPTLAGQNRANPVAAILCVALLFKDHGFQAAHDDLVSAVSDTIGSGVRTEDIGGQHSTSEVAAAIRHALR